MQHTVVEVWFVILKPLWKWDSLDGAFIEISSVFLFTVNEAKKVLHNSLTLILFFVHVNDQAKLKIYVLFK